MLNAENSNHFLTLHQAALAYAQQGYSVLPVHTDSIRAKAAAVSWRQYQQRRPTPDELRLWFLEQRHPGVAIVTGDVSGLAVLDFDDRAVFAEFQHQHPDLAATRIIRTRRGFHLWFAMPAHGSSASRKGKGVDWKAAGGYVVAPPTCIDGHSYIVIDPAAPYLLTAANLVTIRAFLNSTLYSAEVREQAHHQLIPETHDLIQRYRRDAVRGGRNEALFQVSCCARDSGYSMQSTLNLLAKIHAHQPAIGFHTPENPRQRYQEARATIHSAYSRSPRSQIQPSRGEVEQLPNSVREKLFQLGCTHTVRVIEALRLKGVQPGQALTYAQIVNCLTGQVGQWSIRTALAATTPDGVTLFERIPPDPPKTQANADSIQANSLTILANGSAEKPSRTPAHRPPTYYLLPSNGDLCRKLSTLASPSDPLTAEDLASAKQTRMAAHRELVKRRPGLYPRRWLARRLGVDVGTLDSYNRAIPIQVRSCFSERPISWHNLDDLPLALEIGGTFLEDETGKRYPAKREIARKLLAHRHSLTYKRQEANYYAYSHILQVDTVPKLIHDPRQSLQRTPINHAPPSAPWMLSTASASPSNARQEATRQTSPLTPVSEATDRDVAAENRLAERVYRAIRRLSPDQTQRMSKANAHRLVETYGVVAVEQGLKKLKWYAGKGKITKPAGFLITTSRLAWRELHCGAGMNAPAPRFRGTRKGSEV